MRWFNGKGFRKSGTGTVPVEPDAAGRYTEEVCSQIRYQRARPYIERELSDHIEDWKRDLLQEGVHEAEALERAVSEMGDAITVGQELDRIHRPKPEWSIIVTTVVMLCIGALVQYYLSIKGAEGEWSARTAFHDYLTALPIGIAVLLAIYFADYTVLGKYPKRIYAGLLLFWAAYCLFNGHDLINGYPVTAYYHGIYFALILLPAYGAVLYSYRNGGYGSLLKCGAAAVLALLLFSNAQRVFVPIFFAVGGLTLITAAIARGWFKVEKRKAFILVYAPTLLCAMGLFLFKLWRYGDQKDVFLARIKGLFLSDPDTPAIYLSFVVRNIVKNAQFIGQGKTGPMIKTGTAGLEQVLPVWWSDFSLTYLIHQWGLMVGVLLLALFIFLIIKMIRAAMRQKNALGFIVSLSAVTAIGMQCALFFSANLGICQLVTLPLPLITTGQTCFIVDMALIGLLLSAYRNVDVVRDTEVHNSIHGRIDG